MEDILFIFSNFAGAILSTCVLIMMVLYSSKTKPKYLTQNSGVIGINKIYVVILLIIGLLIAFTGLWLYTHQVSTLLCTILFGMGSLLFFSSTYGLDDYYDINWDQNGVSGQSKQFTLKLRKSRTFIAWNDIQAVGENSFQNDFIEASDGRRIFWNYGFSGYVDFHRVLRQKLKPEIFLFN